MSVQAPNRCNGSIFHLSAQEQATVDEAVQILKHQEAFIDYSRLCRALWGTNGSKIQADLDSGYTAAEMPRLKQKYLDLCKLNIMLATTLEKTQVEFRTLMEAAQTQIRTKFGHSPVLMTQQTSRLHDVLKGTSGLIAKNQLLASYTI